MNKALIEEQTNMILYVDENWKINKVSNLMKNCPKKITLDLKQ